MRVPAAALILLALPLPAMARSERCLLEVDGKPYILGRCNVARERDGGLMVGTDGEKISGPYFAIVTPADSGEASATWNETPGATHAQTQLGDVRKSGGCWLNARVKVCAWPQP